MTQVRVDSQLRCPYCHDSLVGAGRKTGCESCFAWHHAACIAELGRCANCSAQTRAPRARTLEFERLRLNELLAKGCRVQGCRSIETIRVGAGYQCRRHVLMNSRILWAVSVSSGVMGSGVLLLAFVQSHLRADDWVGFSLAFAVFCLLSWLFARKSRSMRRVLREFEDAERPQETPPPKAPAASSAPEAPAANATAKGKISKLSA